MRDMRLAAPPDLAIARTCYDHLAGRLGVALFDVLVERRALEPVANRGFSRAGARQPVRLGPAAAEVFRQLDVDVDAHRRGRRAVATACLDWTERRPHLAGALGAAICDRLIAHGWVERRTDSRAVNLTPSGTKRLRELLGEYFDLSSRSVAGDDRGSR